MRGDQEIAHCCCRRVATADTTIGCLVGMPTVISTRRRGIADDARESESRCHHGDQALRRGGCRGSTACSAGSRAGHVDTGVCKRDHAHNAIASVIPLSVKWAPWPEILPTLPEMKNKMFRDTAERRWRHRHQNHVEITLGCLT